MVTRIKSNEKLVSWTGGRVVGFPRTVLTLYVVDNARARGTFSCPWSSLPPTAGKKNARTTSNILHRSTKIAAAQSEGGKKQLRGTRTSWFGVSWESFPTKCFLLCRRGENQGGEGGQAVPELAEKTNAGKGSQLTEKHSLPFGVKT